MSVIKTSAPSKSRPELRSEPGGKSSSDPDSGPGVPGSAPPTPTFTSHQDREGHGGRRIGWLAALFSVGLHLFVIIWYSSFRVGIPTVLQQVAPAPVSDFVGTQIVRLIEIPPAPAEQEVVQEQTSAPEPEPVAEIAPPVAETPAPVLPTAAASTEEVDPRTTAERVRIDATDTLISLEYWEPLNPAFTALTNAELVSLIAALGIEELNDSISAIMEANRRGTDWTFTDSDGGRWGVADGTIYLGDFAIPFFKLDFGRNPYETEADRLRGIEEELIRRGASAQAARQAIEERAKAMRERIDRERRERRGEPPDTTRSGGNGPSSPLSPG